MPDEMKKLEDYPVKSIETSVADLKDKYIELLEKQVMLLEKQLKTTQENYLAGVNQYNPPYNDGRLPHRREIISTTSRLAKLMEERSLRASKVVEE